MQPPSYGRETTCTTMPWEIENRDVSGSDVDETRRSNVDLSQWT